MADFLQHRPDTFLGETGEPIFLMQFALRLQLHNQV
jgi:hypothetical protein